MGNCAQSFAAAGKSVGVGGKTFNAADFGCIAIAFLGLPDIVARGEKQHGLAVCSFYRAAHVGGNAALACQNAEVNSFQMGKVGKVAFNGHQGFPGLNFVAVMQGMDGDVFGIVGAGFNKRYSFVNAAYNDIFAGKHLHHNARVMVVAV